jgi:hypothetical protein
MEPTQTISLSTLRKMHRKRVDVAHAVVHQDLAFTR